MTVAQIKKSLRKHADRKKAEFHQRFFKTGPGEYAHGDKFIGLTVPQIRRVAKEGRELSLTQVRKLLHSPIHEERLLALIILVDKYERESEDRGEIYRLYLKNSKYINNWDLVDCSAPKIVGAYLEGRSKAVLARLAKSKDLWERRIAILSTFYFIQRRQFEVALRVSKLLVHDDHDLIHKAVGWMLREIGKRDKKAEERFLKKHYKTMPRTMLRYAIEKFPETRRKAYLLGRVS